MDETRCWNREEDGGTAQLPRPTVHIELAHPARDAASDDSEAAYALAYGLGDMVFYCWLCRRIPIVMAERHPGFLFEAALVAPDQSVHRIPGLVDVVGMDFPDGQDHSDEEDELCFGLDGFSDEVLGLVGGLRAEAWDADLTDEHGAMAWEDTPEMGELIARLTDWGQGAVYMTS